MTVAETMPMWMRWVLNALAVVIATHEKLGRFDEHFEHFVPSASFHVLSAEYPTARPQSNRTYSSPGQGLGS